MVQGLAISYHLKILSVRVYKYPKIYLIVDFAAY